MAVCTGTEARIPRKKHLHEHASYIVYRVLLLDKSNDFAYEGAKAKCQSKKGNAGD